MKRPIEARSVECGKLRQPAIMTAQISRIERRAHAHARSAMAA